MNIFLFCYIFLFQNKQLTKNNILRLSLRDNDNNNNTKKTKIYISKKYIIEMMNIDNNNYKLNEQSIPTPLLDGINYAYPYEDYKENNKILNNINKNLQVKKKLNILDSNKVSNDFKLKIASEYLYINTTKYKININNGRLFDDWSFNF
jgi:hypothetical protein